MSAEKTKQSTTKPRRSALYIPGSNDRALEKVKSLDVDSIIFDLEDSIAPEQKEMARINLTKFLQNGGYGHRELVIRINSINTPWGMEDLSTALSMRPDAILIPKVSCPEDLKKIENLIDNEPNSANTKLWIMMETPMSIVNANAIVEGSGTGKSRLSALVMGTNDLAKETGASLSNNRFAMISWLMTCLAVARAHGLVIIDGVFNDIANFEGFKAECQQGRDMGMDGKTLIHPNQIEPCNEIFSPTPESILWSQKVIKEFDKSENSDKGVIQIDGKMVERLHLQIARQTVSVAKSIKNRKL